jgi:serine/threonine protein kinase
MPDSKPVPPHRPGTSDSSAAGGIESDAAPTFDQRATQTFSAPALSTFVVGDILAGRFQVIRYIARGGMGEVYEAEDTELNERVALKTARLETAQGAHDTERFRREIQLARKVTHPNVCRTFDVFRHITPEHGGHPRSEILIVSMELLAGETLDKLIRREGRLTTSAAFPIIAQMVAGLGAAHQAGVIHRDFKTSNVMLVAPTAQASQSTRVVITDFGLAHAEEKEGHTLTRPGDIVGTPAYMAPEQIEGGNITAATDIYALGIVIYEMITGVLPFSADTPLATAMKRLNHAAPSARAHIPDLDEKWESVLARCLERAPEKRFARTEDVLKALQGEAVTPPFDSLPTASLTGPRVDPSRRISSQFLSWGRVPAAIAALLLLIAGIAVWTVRQHQASLDAKNKAAASTPASGRRAVAILGFANLSGNSSADALGNILADSLWSQLDTDEIRFIVPSAVDEMKNNLGLRDTTTSLSGEQAAAIKKFLGADVLITGSYTATGPPGHAKIEWNIHLLGTNGGESLGSVVRSGDESDLNSLVLHAGRLIRQKLGIQLSPAEEARMDASLSTNPDAMRYFSEGRNKLRNFDVLAATKSLEKSIEADPKFAQARSTLAEAWAMLGYDSNARDEAKRALDLAGGLPTEDRDLVSARYYAASHDWPKAITQYSQLWSQYPDDPQYGLLLAATQINSGQATAGLTTLTQLRSQNPPTGILAQADLLEAAAQTSLADYKKVLVAATSAAQKAQSLGANLLLARALIQQCAAYLNLGQPDQATPACDGAKKLNASAGDRLAAANSANAIANVYFNQANYVAAAPLYEEALSTARSIGDKQDEAGALNNLANIKDAQNDRSGAIKMYRQSIDVARERGDMADVAMAQLNLASELYMSGDRVAGRAMLALALAGAEKIEDHSTESHILHDACVYALNDGALADAQRDCEKSLRLRRDVNDSLGIGQSLTIYGDVQTVQDDLAGAARSYGEAITTLDAMRDSVAAKSAAAYARISSASLALEQGHAAASEKFAGDAAEELAKENDVAAEAAARGLLARSLLEQNKLPTAGSEIQKAQALAEKSGDVGAKLDVATTAARIDARSGKSAQALQSLVTIQKDAKAANLVQAVLEARLAFGEIQLETGSKDAGRATLRSLAQDATIRGFVLIAQKAAAAADQK